MLLLSTTALAAGVEDLSYAIKDDGTIEITACSDTASGVLEIPPVIDGRPVTSIGEFAFQFCGSLTSVTIPESVTSIGAYAFHGSRMAIL